MATEIIKFVSTLKKIKDKAKKQGLYAAQANYKALKDAYKAVLGGEQKVIDALPDARESGVTGNTLKDFQRDPAFKKVFKAYDLLVTELDSAEKVCYEMTTNGETIIFEINELEQTIRKEYKDSKIASIVDLLKDIGDQKKKLSDSATIYDISRDKDMHLYSTKFKKRVDALLEHAPKSDKQTLSALPADFEPEARSKEYKIIRTIQERITKMKTKIESVLKDQEKLSQKIILYAEKDVSNVEELVDMIDKKLKHVQKLIDSSKATVKKEGDATNETKLADMVKFVALVTKEHKTAAAKLNDVKRTVEDSKARLKENLAQDKAP